MPMAYPLSRSPNSSTPRPRWAGLTLNVLLSIRSAVTSRSNCANAGKRRGIRGQTQLSIFNGLRLQTFLLVRFEPKGLFGTLTNPNTRLFFAKTGESKGSRGLYLTLCAAGSSRVADRFDTPLSRFHNYPPRWNGAPSQELLVIRRNHQTGEVSLDPLRWELIPYWWQRPCRRTQTDQC